MGEYLKLSAGSWYDAEKCLQLIDIIQGSFFKSQYFIWSAVQNITEHFQCGSGNVLVVL